MVTDADPGRKVAVMGQSCGGLEAVEACADPRVDTLPAFLGHLPVGHFGTFSQANGGEHGRVGSARLRWQLNGDQAARSLFVGPSCGLCRRPQWTVASKNLS